MKITRYEALVLAVSRAKNQTEFGNSLGVNQGQVSKWLNSSKQLPGDYVLKVEELYDVSRHVLRPDLYPVDLSPTQKSRFRGVDNQRVAAAS